MQLHSQHDPSFDRLTLGTSNLTIHGFGCFFISICNLFGKDPIAMLKTPSAFDSSGLLFPAVLARACGGDYKGVMAEPDHGWQIAMTDHYAPLGYPTHFFCVNMDTHEQIDPLKFPAVIEPLTYSIKELRGFTGVVLGTERPEPAWFKDVPVGAPYAEDLKECVAAGIFVMQPNFSPDVSPTRAQLAQVVARLLRHQKS